MRGLMLQSRGAQFKSSKEHHEDGGGGRAKATWRRPIVEKLPHASYLPKKGAKRDVAQNVMANFRLANVPVLHLHMLHLCQKKGEARKTALQRTSIKMEENAGLVGLWAGCRLGPGGCPGGASEGDPHGAWRLIRAGPERGYPRRGQRAIRAGHER